jgi:hypothetical protein
MFDAILNRAPVAPVRLNADLPPELERIINRALEKDRELRYQHASEMRSELLRLKRDTESGRRPVPVAAGGEQAQEAPRLSGSGMAEAGSTPKTAVSVPVQSRSFR